MLNIKTATASDWKQLKEEIKEAASTVGIDKIGFTTADPFTALKNRLLEHRRRGHESGFEQPDIEKRVNPSASFDEPRAILSIAVAYPSKLADPPKSEPGAYRGILARSSWGLDYHIVLRERLTRLDAFIKERVTGARLEIMVDTGALVDRAVAERAGVGWSGKNCAIITPEWGSWVYLGEMITNIPFEPDQPITEDCGDCTMCIDACPTSALVGPGQLNATQCISFLTQTKETVPDELKEKIGNRLYGCDTCQVVCPKNKGKHWTHHDDLQPEPDTVKPLLRPILKLSNKAFKREFGHTAAAWRGKKPIQRNAIIGLGKFRDSSALPELEQLLLHDKRPAIRETAAWALGKIGSPQAFSVLKKAMEEEIDELVTAAISKAMARTNAGGEKVGR